MGVSAEGIKIMSPKAVHRVIKVSNIDVRAASIMKQEMLSKGGEVAAPWTLYKLEPGKTDILVMGTRRQFDDLCDKLRLQPFGLAKLGQEIKKTLDDYDKPSRVIKAGTFALDLNAKTHVMGILNTTPDSFSDGGLYLDIQAAVEHARVLVESGADILDIGGESTRPGAKAVDIDEELRRTIPVIEALATNLKVPISIDTYKPEVASRAINAGAVIINDITGLGDERMIEVAADKRVPVVIMHMQGTPGNMQENPTYDDVMFDICEWMQSRITRIIDSGVSDENILIDPGVGFGKSFMHNLEIMDRLSELKSLGYPIVLGTSRKVFLGAILDAPPDDRLEGTIATVVQGINNGANIVRVHDVKQVVKACRVADAIMRRKSD
ncbi:MAG: dihydropteroate synthase [Rubrobacteridae bacterium]|nr:dihydropteroate synthase [Rubrobacteridae bacterium]